MSPIKLNTNNHRRRKDKDNVEPMYKSSKRLALLIFSSLYCIIVLANLFGGKVVDDKILTSLEIIIGACIGGITASGIFKK